MTRCAIYTRFSPRRNAATCESCETQEQLCLAFAARHGWEVVGTYHDKAVSGDTWPRPNLEQAMAELGEGDVLLAYMPDRFSRSVYLSELVQHIADDTGFTVRTVEGDITKGDTSPEAILIRQVLASVAEYHKRRIAARTRIAMRQMQKSGKRVSRFPPYGFRFDKDDKKKLVPVKKEQLALERAKVLIGEGHTNYMVAKLLDEEHPTAARGKKWNHKSIARLRKRL